MKQSTRGLSPTKSHAGHFDLAQVCWVLVNIGEQLIFWAKIASTNLRPNLVLWYITLKTTHILELTVPWKNFACQHKKVQFVELAAEAK